MTPALAARARQVRAEADHRAAVAAFRARRQADGQRSVDALITEVVAVLAEAMRSPGTRTCPDCRHAMTTRARTCQHCKRDHPHDRDPWDSDTPDQVSGMSGEQER